MLNCCLVGIFKNSKQRSYKFIYNKKYLTDIYFSDILLNITESVIVSDIYNKYENIYLIVSEGMNKRKFKLAKKNSQKLQLVEIKSLLLTVFDLYEKGVIFNEESISAKRTGSIQSRSGCNTGVCGQGSRESIKNETEWSEVGGIGYGPLSSITQCKERGKDSDSLSLLLYERPVKAEASKFREAILNYKSLNLYSAAVDVHDLSEYSDMSCYLYDDGKAGVAVQSSGNIVSVFKTKDSKIKKFAIKSTKDAIANGGTKLDCYSINGFLPNQYMQAGMRPICKIRFNKEFAPDGWDFERDGEPDIVFMAVGNNIHDIYQEYTDEEVPYIEDSETECAYDLAEKYRDNILSEHKEKKFVVKSEPDAFEIVENLQSGASELFSKFGKVFSKKRE